MAEISVAPPIDVEQSTFHLLREPSIPHSLPNGLLSSPPTDATSPPRQRTYSPNLSSHDQVLSSHHHGASSSSTSTTHSDPEDAYATTDDERIAYLKPQTTTDSSRSSISSLPASVAPDYAFDKPSTPTQSLGHSHGHFRLRSGIHSTPNSHPYDENTIKINTPFRNPSSVRAMQMRDEYMDEEELTPSRHHNRHPGSHRSNTGRLSIFSERSHSNSTTRTPTKNRSGLVSPQKPPSLSSSSKLKKEFPLILLHCNLLPPTLPLQIRIISDPMLLREVLPEVYWRRWKVLEERIKGNPEVMARGVLIPHPRGDYELLEEKLLESLELEGPRIKAGHFLGAQEEKGNVTEESEESEVEGILGTRCQDCGKKVPVPGEMKSKWEVKVFAANGLMRAGAWGAAWGEMEKVDVEVGVGFPEDVKSEIEARLHEMGFSDVVQEEVGHGHGEEHEHMQETEEERRRREVYGSPEPVTQEKIDGLYDPERHATPKRQGKIPAAEGRQVIDLHILIINYLKALAQDKRNILIAFLSMLVLFYAIAKPSERPLPTPSVPSQPIPQVVTMTVTATPPQKELPSCTVESSQVSSASESAVSQPGIVETMLDAGIPAVDEQVVAEVLRGEASAAVIEQVVAEVLGEEAPPADVA